MVCPRRRKRLYFETYHNLAGAIFNDFKICFSGNKRQSGNLFGTSAAPPVVLLEFFKLRLVQNQTLAAEIFASSG
jgi:hypothetical protein